MIKAVMFDMDGTLIYVDREYRRRLIRDIIKRFNKDAPDEELDEFWFMHSRQLMLEKWEIDVKEFWKSFYKNDDPEKRMAHTFVYDDIDYLKELKKRGIKIALYTSARWDIAKESIKLFEKDLFDIVVVAEPFKKITPKPDPEGALVCLKKLGTKKQETIYVGNSDEDLLTARRAGIFSVLIDRKEHKHDLKPDMTIYSLNELDKIIK